MIFDKRSFVEIKNFKSIAIFVPNWIGDSVMAIPTINIVKDLNNSIVVGIVCKRHIAQIFANENFVDDIVIKDDDNVIENLRKYEIALLMTNSFSSALMAWKARIPIRIGFSKDCRYLFLTHRVKFSKAFRTSEHQINTYKRLLQHFECNAMRMRMPTISIPSSENRKIVKKYMGDISSEIVVGINPGADYGDAKCWPLDRFQEVIKKLIAIDKVTVCIFGSTNMYNKEFIIEDAKVKNFVGKTSVSELIFLINACDVFLSNDSGPMHIASALNVPVVAIFGSTNPTASGPYSDRTIVIKEPTRCSPCFSRRCKKDFACMQNISSAKVFNAILSIVKTCKKLPK